MDFAIEDRATGLAVIQHLQGRAASAGVALREPPPEPVGCCGRGCNGCVWEGWFSAVAYWRDESLFALEP
ncbi:oxidoreductase-like domain-containing protein [Aquabacterium sp. OR-4]|uniref:oxidoreductase-like domain-containing protein n=1 Tax=Aquabacterium sp. OR-4 TaxID=2978127 RepID=UPI0021B19BAB|nr:oxidoreductase-like domain-containing protein [Aquabacterium sp. OR-4]MDT7835133.1 oxidoreductase-like domain-containing protein [Aquabacterium sp. OR-4]